MDLEKHINNCIYTYPTLYRGRNHEESRINVLGHTFLSIGAGMEFHPDGFWTTWEWKDRNDDDNLDINWHLDELDELPPNFYEMELWYVDVLKKDMPAFEKEIEGHFFYTRHPMHGDGKEYVFESTEVFAAAISEKYCFSESSKSMIEMWKIMKKHLPDYDGYKVYPSAAANFSRIDHELLNDEKKGESKYYKGYSPYPSCNYSPISEMIEKQTDSLHMPNRPVINIRPDWIKGALDVCKYALDYYNDPEKYKFDMHHPDRCLREFKERYETDHDNFHERDDWEEGMTIEEYCEASFQRHRQEQIGYMTKVIEMYGNQITT